MNNVIFTRVNIYRNLKDYKFVPKLVKEKAQEIEDKVTNALGNNFHKVIIGSADAGLLNYLIENSLMSKNTKGVLLDKNNSISVSLFENEQIYIRSTGFGFSKSAIENALNLSNELSSKISMAYNDDYGYLMSNLSLLGTGLQIECDLDLNAIVAIGKIEQVKQNVKNLGLILKEKEPNVFTLFNQCKLGFNEKEIVSEFEKMVAKLQDLEVESAKMLMATKHDEVMDRTGRTKAILSSAYLMNSEELKKHLSILRTALNLNIVNFKPETINNLQKLIMNKNNEIISQSELVSLAKNVREILKGEQNV